MLKNTFTDLLEFRGSIQHSELRRMLLHGTYLVFGSFCRNQSENIINFFGDVLFNCRGFEWLRIGQQSRTPHRPITGAAGIFLSDVIGKDKKSQSNPFAGELFPLLRMHPSVGLRRECPGFQRWRYSLYGLCALVDR
jgi:hypothetical protein